MKGLLLETIRCQEGRLQHLAWHQERASRSSRALFGSKAEVNLGAISVPPEAATGVFKCRVLYDTCIRKIEYSPYSIRPVKKLRLMSADRLEYRHKFADRAKIQELFNLRGGADDILIVKNGLITDTSYANVALFDGAAWHTPASPLLQGTRRAGLIAAGKLVETDIPAGGLPIYKEVRLINAMMDLCEGPCLLPVDII